MKHKFELWPLLASMLFLFLTWIVPDFLKYQSFFTSPTPIVTPTVISQKMIVTRVIDGDTIELSTGEKVRYIGIDTPERSDCFFSEAKTINAKLVLNKEVELKKDVSQTDKYGRLLRYVYVDGLFVNDYLVKEGYAYVTTYPPDVKYSKSFLESQTQARENKKGFWAEDVCN